MKKEKIPKLLITDYCRMSTSKGFTAVELLVVITIIGVIIALAVPNFAEMHRLARIRAGAEEVAQDFRQIRERALSTGTAFQVSFPDNRTFMVTDLSLRTTTYKLGGTTGGRLYFGAVDVSGCPPEGSGDPPCDGIDFPNKVVYFNARGGVDQKGVVYITDGRKNYAVGVNSLGKMKIYKYGNKWY